MTACKASLHLVGAMLTDVGRVRSANEDTVMYMASRADKSGRQSDFLALVADGMGGHAAGEVASSLAAETVRHIVVTHNGNAEAMLNQAFQAANTAIRSQAAANPKLGGMGTTCTAILVRDGVAWLAHIGDSRAYLLRNHALHQLSEDHTLHAQLVRDGLMTPAEAASTPGGNVILAALGAKDAILPAVSREGLPLQIDDVLILCSDGLTAVVSDHAILSTCSEMRPHEACRSLLQAALNAGAPDNVSVGVFAVGHAAPSRSANSATKPIHIGSSAGRNTGTDT